MASNLTNFSNKILFKPNLKDFHFLIIRMHFIENFYESKQVNKQRQHQNFTMCFNFWKTRQHACSQAKVFPFHAERNHAWFNPAQPADSVSVKHSAYCAQTILQSMNITLRKKTKRYIMAQNRAKVDGML